MKLRTLSTRLVVAALLGLSWLSLPRASYADDAPASGKWEKVTSDSGINVFKKDVEGSPIIAFKGDGVIDANILRVASVLTDTSRSKEWIDRLVDAAVLETISPLERIQYTHIKTPPGLDDRDFVARAKMTIDGENKRITVAIHSTTHPSKPAGANGIVRGELLGSSFLLVPLPGGKTRVITEIHADPKGSVPKFVVNMVQKDWPINTIKGLRKQVGRASDNEALKAHLIEKGFEL